MISIQKYCWGEILSLGWSKPPPLLFDPWWSITTTAQMCMYATLYVIQLDKLNQNVTSKPLNTEFCACCKINKDNKALNKLSFKSFSIILQTTLSNWDLSVDKNSLSISPTDKTLSKHIQTVDRQRLAGQHVSCLQTAFIGVSIEPCADEGLVPSSWGHHTARHHAIIPPTWNTITTWLELHSGLSLTVAYAGVHQTCQ